MQYLVIIFIILIILGVILSVLVALASFILPISTTVAGLGILAGIVWGSMLPIRILKGKTPHPVTVATPDAVVGGGVFSGPPKGPAANFGWDWAWPNYIPYQLKHDKTAVRVTGEQQIRTLWRKMRAFWFRPRGGIIGLILSGFWWITLGLPALGVTLGAIVGTGLWFVGITVAQWIVSASQRAQSRRMVDLEQKAMDAQDSVPACPSCHRRSTMPTYRCPGCGTLHRDLSPGPLGITERICGCGVILPTTVVRASAVLEAICPYCDGPLIAGAGTRRSVPLPVFGSVGTGKTQFLASLAVGLRAQEQQGAGYRISPRNQAADRFLETSLSEAQDGRAPLKTPHSSRAESIVYTVEGAGTEFELRLIDAAGENFVTADGTRSLTYLDEARMLVFILDPLTLPEIRDEAALAGVDVSSIAAQGSATDAYASVIDRLRSSGVDLSDRRLAVVVSKSDLLDRILPGDRLEGRGAAVRGWLDRRGADALLRRIELDVRTVEYFAVDSRYGTDAQSPRHPLRVLEWALEGTAQRQLFAAPSGTESKAEENQP